MATTQIGEPNGTHPPSEVGIELEFEPRKNKGGRPPGSKTRNRTFTPPPAEADDAVETLAAHSEETRNSAHAYVKPRDMDFWDWLSTFKPGDWGSLIAYVYRTAPTIDKRRVGQTLYITKYVTSFDQDTIKGHHGSGGYRIDICRRSEVTGESFRLAQHYAQILDPEYPPKVPPGEWIDAPENEMWAWAKPAIQAAQAQRSGQAPGSELKTVLEHLDRARPAEDSSVALEMQRGMNRLQEIIAEQNDPKRLIDLALALNGGGNKGPDPMIQMLMEDRKHQQQQIAALTDKIMNAPAQKPLIEQLAEIDKVAKIMHPQSKTKGTDGWMDIANKMIDVLPIALESFRKSPMNGQPQQDPRNGFVTRPHHQAAQPAHEPAQETVHTAAAPTAEPGEDDMPAVDNATQARFDQILGQWGPLIQSVATILVDKYRAGEDGYEFRDWFISRKGNDAYMAFRDAMTADELTALAQQHTFLKVALAPPERLLVFFQEFWTLPEDTPQVD